MSNPTVLSPFRSERFYHAASAQVRAPIAVSACLLGEPVRYDGTDQRQAAIEHWLGSVLQLLTICPEVGAGLGVPRPPVQLVLMADANYPEARGRDDPALDVTAALKHYAEQSARALSTKYPLCGYLFKSRSPSCGVGSTPLFNRHGNKLGATSGIQADYFQRELPWLVFGEETTLVDADHAQRFILQCRLVFDVLHASATPLVKYQRHYRFLSENFSADIQTKLNDAAAAETPALYLSALHAGCHELPIGQLLDLFTFR